MAIPLKIMTPHSPATGHYQCLPKEQLGHMVGTGPLMTDVDKPSLVQDCTSKTCLVCPVEKVKSELDVHTYIHSIQLSSFKNLNKAFVIC